MPLHNLSSCVWFYLSLQAAFGLILVLCRSLHSCRFEGELAQREAVVFEWTRVLYSLSLGKLHSHRELYAMKYLSSVVRVSSVRVNVCLWLLPFST